MTALNPLQILLIALAGMKNPWITPWTPRAGTEMWEPHAFRSRPGGWQYRAEIGIWKANPLKTTRNPDFYNGKDWRMKRKWCCCIDNRLLGKNPGIPVNK